VTIHSWRHAPIREYALSVTLSVRLDHGEWNRRSGAGVARGRPGRIAPRRAVIAEGKMGDASLTTMITTR
jgi:hypothetical protein